MEGHKPQCLSLNSAATPRGLPSVGRGEHTPSMATHRPNRWRFGYLLQLIGSALLVVVVLTHVAEAFHLFPRMGWGLPNSVGHYIDLVSAIAGPMLLSAGLLSRRLVKHRISN
jgi:hypothetical protein